MTLRQLYEWHEYFKLEPFGFPAHDQMHARQMWATISASATKEWRGKPEDFLMRPAEPAEVEVDPVEYLSQFFGPPPERDDEESPLSEMR